MKKPKFKYLDSVQINHPFFFGKIKGTIKMYYHEEPSGEVVYSVEVPNDMLVINENNLTRIRSKNG